MGSLASSDCQDTSSSNVVSSMGLIQEEAREAGNPY